MLCYRRAHAAHGTKLFLALCRSRGLLPYLHRRSHAGTSKSPDDVGVNSQALCVAPRTGGIQFVGDTPYEFDTSGPVYSSFYCNQYSWEPAWRSNIEVIVQFAASTAYAGVLNHNPIADGRFCAVGNLRSSVQCSQYPPDDTRATLATEVYDGPIAFNLPPAELQMQSGIAVTQCPTGAPYPISARATVEFDNTTPFE
jgi:hypothetical protein